MLISLFWKSSRHLRVPNVDNIWWCIVQTTYCPLWSQRESRNYAHCQIHWRQPTETHILCMVGDLSLHSLTMQKDWKITYIGKKCSLGRFRHSKKIKKTVKSYCKEFSENVNIQLSTVIFCCHMRSL